MGFGVTGLSLGFGFGIALTSQFWVGLGGFLCGLVLRGVGIIYCLRISGFRLAGDGGFDPVAGCVVVLVVAVWVAVC